MPEIDHRVGEGLECVMQLTETIKAKEQPPELIFPGKDPLDRPKPFPKYSRIEQRLAASLWLLSTTYIRVDIGDHATIENRFAVSPTVVDAIQAVLLQNSD